MFFLIMIITLGSCGIADNKKSPEQVLSEASKLLDSWETVHYSATTLNNKTTHTNVYNLKKVSYEPHLNLFFSKEIDKEITIYYKLASLKVVEDRKKKITTFDYANDRSVPKYLESYMGADDTILFLKSLLTQFKEDIVYLEELDFSGKAAYVYKFQNYKLWIDATQAIPLKLEIAEKKMGTKRIIYNEVVFNEKMEDATFTHIDKDDYISSVFGIKKEPLLNTKAPHWTLKDLNGKEVTLKEFKGSPIFLEAWVSSCSHCMESIPRVKLIQKEFGDKIKIITVNFDYNIAITKEVVQDKNISYTVLQGDASFDVNYDIRSYPSYFVIDRNGDIIFSEAGTIENKKESALLEVLRKIE